MGIVSVHVAGHHRRCHRWRCGSDEALNRSAWQHERTVLEEGDGCVLTDRLTFEPKLGGPLVAAFLRAVFRNRHRVLREKFRGH